MSDRFDITFDTKLDTKPYGDAGAMGARTEPRLEVIRDAGWRRSWSDDDKARVIVESLAPGVNVSAVARRHGIKPQQLFAWRREARALFECGPGGASPSTVRPATGPAPLPMAPCAPLKVDARVFAPPVFAPVLIAAARSSMTQPAEPIVPAARPSPAARTIGSQAAGPDRVPSAASPAPAAAGVIEIVVGAVTVRLSGRIEADALADVLAAVRRTP